MALTILRKQINIKRILIIDFTAYRRVCYFGSWAHYRKQAGHFTPEKIDTNLCTHIIYAFATLKGNRPVAADYPDESTTYTKGM